MQIGRSATLEQILREPLSRNYDGPRTPSETDSTIHPSEPALDHKQTDEHVKRVNRVLEQHQSKLMFRVRQEDGRQIVQLIEKEGEKVILQLPPEGLLELEKRLQDATGSVVDVKM
jgi:uncharacterized FlaG/YvyC family protein